MELKNYSFIKVLYEYNWEDNNGNSYNEDYDKFLTTKEFKDMDKAIEYAKKGIIKKGYNINEIDDLSTDIDQEVIIFYGKDISKKDGSKFERAIKIVQDDNILVQNTLIHLLNNKENDI